jgi:flagellar motility protein MotE (MotC chaperone)
MKFKHLLVVAGIAVVSFPVLYFAALFMTGNAHLEFTSPANRSKESEKKELATIRQTARKDSIAATQSHSFIALENARTELEDERQKLKDQEQRIGMLQQELEAVKNELVQKRKEMEELVAQSSELDRKRVAQLAKVYAAMRADEAARILETLDDELAIKVLMAIGDDRQKGKIFTALSSEKAGRISKALGK